MSTPLQQTYLILGSSLGATSSIDLSAADYAFVGENAPSAKEASRFDLRKFKFKPLPNWNPYE